MRRLKETEIVRAQVRRYGKIYDGFEHHYDYIVWWLRRDPSMGLRTGQQIEERNPPTYVIETIAMRAIGIPRVVLAYSDDGTTVEIQTLAVY